MIDVDGNELGAWGTASLRIASEDLSAEDISERLGLRATSARVNASSARDGERLFSVWLHDAGLPPSEPVEDHLMLLVERLRDRTDALSDLVSIANVELWVSFSPGQRQRSVVIDARTISTVASLGIDLVIDTYPSTS